MPRSIVSVLAGALALGMEAAEGEAQYHRYHGGAGLRFGYTAPAPFYPLYQHRYVNPYRGNWGYRPRIYYGGFGGPRYYGPWYYAPVYYSPWPRYGGPAPYWWDGGCGGGNYYFYYYYWR